MDGSSSCGFRALDGVRRSGDEMSRASSISTPCRNLEAAALWSKNHPMFIMEREILQRKTGEAVRKDL